MAIVLSQTQTSVVTLSGISDNPATITATGVLLDGLYADSLSAAAWTVTNAGSVLGAGITLQSVGTVINNGSIVGGGTGVDLLAGGYVGNATGGTISGGVGAGGNVAGAAGGAGGDGVDLAAVAALSNLGTIIGGSGGYANNTGNTFGVGGAGGTGIDATAGATIANSGAVSGGTGAQAASGGPSSQVAVNGSGGMGGAGVDLATGGSLTNAGTISGGEGGSGGFDFFGGQLGNAGGGGIGVDLAAGTDMSNAGAIFGGGGGAGANNENAGFGSGGSGGSGGVGVDLAAGDILTNAGTISGGYGGGGGSGFPVGGDGGNGADGIDLLASATVTNSGTIAGGGGGGGDSAERGGDGGNGGWGVSLASAGFVTNKGTITGGSGGAGARGVPFSGGSGNGGGGVYIGGGTLVNAGAIIGGSGGQAGDAVAFGSLAATLAIDPGAVFEGAVAANPNAADTMELGGTTAGSLSGIGDQFTGFTRIVVDPEASWTLNGSLTGAGTVMLEGASALDLAGSVSAGQTIIFSGGDGLLGIDPNAFSGTIDGFTIGGSIDLSGVTDGFSPHIINGNTLEIERSGHAPVDLTLDPGVAYTGDSYAVSRDGIVTQETPCFLRGTLIRTERGEVPVELLTTADRVLTLSGRLRPVAWIGTGRVLVSPGKRCAATPVIVRKGALADNVPHVDLYITKGHALFVDGVLIPAEFLVNHRSILWDDLRKTVAFYHVELDEHDVLVANGAPAESYRDDGNRWLFQNANAGWDQPAKPPCAPVLHGGPVVDAVWRRLLDRAEPPRALRLTGDPDLHLVVDGHRVDAATSTDDVFVFALRGLPAAVRVVSLAASPQEIGLDRDPRCLGVALRRLIVRRNTRFQVIKADDERLVEGFHAFEDKTALRWTDGDATLPAALFEGPDGPLELVLQLGGSTRYPAFIGAGGRVAA